MGTVPDGAAATLGGSLQSYLRPVCAVILDLRTPLTVERVHRTRKALRRLRSVLRVYAEAFDRDAAVALEREARWFTGLLGPVRDADVLRQRFSGTAVAETLDQQRRRDSVLARRAVDSQRYRLFRAQIDRWSQQPPFTSVATAPADTMVEFVKDARRVERKRIRNALRPSATDEMLHRARKAARRHRYAGEAARPALGRKARRRVRHSKQLQQILGRHQDAAVATTFLLGIASERELTTAENRLLDADRDTRARAREQFRQVGSD